MWGRGGESMARVKSPPRWISEEADVGARRRVSLHVVQQRRQHRITQASALMLGQHRQVDHVEVPPSIPEHATHGHSTAGS